MPWNVTEAKCLEIGREAMMVGGLMGRVLERVGWEKTDGSLECQVDTDAEIRLCQIVEEILPGLPVLSETLYPTIPRADLHASIDGLDGTADFIAHREEWSHSVGIIDRNLRSDDGRYGGPIAGVIVQPAKKLAFAARRPLDVHQWNCDSKRWSPLVRRFSSHPEIGIDIGPSTPQIYFEEVVPKLVRHFNARAANLPAVAAGVGILLGNISCWISYTGHNWDFAASALFIQSIGGVAECLDGSPIPWDQVRMPPVILADSPKTADEARRAIFG